MTLSFLYRPLLYNFIDHPYTKKLFYFSIPYILIVGFGQTMIENVSNPFKPESDYLLSTGQVLNENYYDDLRIIPVSYTHLDVYKRQHPVQLRFRKKAVKKHLILKLITALFPLEENLIQRG